MTPRLIRVAMLAYPWRWRRAHGEELADLTLCIWADQETFSEKLLTLSDLIGSGIGERVRGTERLHARTSLTSIAALAAVAIAMTGGITADSLAKAVRLAPAVSIGPHVSISSTRPRHIPGPQSRSITVYRPSGGINNLISVYGKPATVKVNPETMQVISITARRRGTPTQPAGG